MPNPASHTAPTLNDSAILWTSDNGKWSIVRNMNDLIRVYRRGDKRPIQPDGWEHVPAYVRFVWGLYQAQNEPVTNGTTPLPPPPTREPIPIPNPGSTEYQVMTALASEPLTPDEIRTTREVNGLTRIELAARMTNATPDQLAMALRIVHLDKRIREWETGRATPSPVYADLLTRALNL